MLSLLPKSFVVLLMLSRRQLHVSCRPLWRVFEGEEVCEVARARCLGQARRCASPARPVQARGPRSPNTLLSCACGPVSVCVEMCAAAGHGTQETMRDDERRAFLLSPDRFYFFRGVYLLFSATASSSSRPVCGLCRALSSDLCARRREGRTRKVLSSVPAGRAAAPMRAHAVGAVGRFLWLSASLHLNAFQR